MSGRLLPTGTCWCDCGIETARGSFFLSGHDKIAVAAVLLVEYRGGPEFLASHGYAPEGKNPRAALAASPQARSSSHPGKLMVQRATSSLEEVSPS